LKYAALALVAGILLSVHVQAAELNPEGGQPNTLTYSVCPQTDVIALFGQDQLPLQIFALSEQEMKETEGSSFIYRCVTCGAPHGGVYSPYHCYNCWSKGYGGAGSSGSVLFLRR
jgi:hypothetical protein